MLNKYKETISKIEASEELKNTIIEKMEKEQAKRRGGIIIKIKKVISTIISLLGIMACGGVVFAAVSGILNINGILFSDEYVNYQEKVENQYLEKDGTKIELVSTMCDEGFLVLQFEVELSDSMLGMAERGYTYLSFNDKLLVDQNGKKYLTFNGSNYNLLIDGEEYWLKGAVRSEIMENIQNKDYTAYQLYFLPSDVVENKETFTITLDDVVVAISPDEGEFLEMDGSFEIEVSKEKAIKNTTTIENENASVKYERLTNKIEKVLQTPMQTIIKTSTLLEGATERNSTYLLAEDYIGHLEYKIYDQNNNELFLYTCISEFEYYYEDGTVKKIPISEIGEFEVRGYNAIRQEEYIVTEKNKDINSLRIEVYENNEYYGTTRNIGTHFIDLEKGKITCENKNTESDYIVLYNGHKINKGTGTYDWNYEESEKYHTKVYYEYGNGKYLGETTEINLDNSVLPIISISKKYDAIPRKYEKVNTIPGKLDFLNKDNVINAEINKIDLDGDGKEEYICCYAIEYKTGDYSDMYEYELLKSHIEIFDSNFNKIGSLIHLESDSDVYLSLEEDAEYIDIDNDGVMEILINIPGWLKWSGLEVFKYNNNQISGNVDSYNYASYRHGA